ncbi:hypothetical protein B0T17DRAFT_511642 [Bombardia bombarda]|uniref:Uncharacterized protein n=1 Tax=Bombardia bombarda TaxID=252184 RepID=A0AA39U749_9PEZI|nr:hypothetical protein B0T17DRAFT_511642 [Bombardia bombarda]
MAGAFICFSGPALAVDSPQPSTTHSLDRVSTRDSRGADEASAVPGTNGVGGASLVSTVTIVPDHRVGAVVDSAMKPQVTATPTSSGPTTSFECVAKLDRRKHHPSTVPDCKSMANSSRVGWTGIISS